MSAACVQLSCKDQSPNGAESGNEIKWKEKEYKFSRSGEAKARREEDTGRCWIDKMCASHLIMLWQTRDIHLSLCDEEEEGVDCPSVASAVDIIQFQTNLKQDDGSA